jgi:hypothetical protein
MLISRKFVGATQEIKVSLGIIKPNLFDEIFELDHEKRFLCNKIRRNYSHYVRHYAIIERARETGQDYWHYTQISQKTPPQGQLWPNSHSMLDGLFLG